MTLTNNRIYMQFWFVWKPFGIVDSFGYLISKGANAKSFFILQLFFLRSEEGNNVAGNGNVEWFRLSSVSRQQGGLYGICGAILLTAFFLSVGSSSQYVRSTEDPVHLGDIMQPNVASQHLSSCRWSILGLLKGALGWEADKGWEKGDSPIFSRTEDWYLSKQNNSRNLIMIVGATSVLQALVLGFLSS